MMNSVYKQLWRLAAKLPLGGRRYCCVCKKSVPCFLPYRSGTASVPPLHRHIGIVGSDIVHFECPACSASDRERHLFLYFDASDLARRIAGARILHMAPERHLSRYIQAALPATYVRGDLYPANASIERIDLSAIPYADASFDVFIANHVLEHVADDQQVLVEIARVLANDGIAILQTPFSAKLATTFQDPGIDNPAARLHAYGQEDHVRLYGRDMVERIAAYGFAPHVRSHAAMLPGIDAARYGVNPEEPFLMFRRIPRTPDLSPAAASQ